MRIPKAPQHFEGVPIFLRSSDLAAELGNSQVMRAIELVKKIGWREALEAVMHLTK